MLNNKIYKVSANEFKKVPGSPIAYWAEKSLFEIFSSVETLKNISRARRGLETGNNEKYLKYWYEVSLQDIAFNLSNMRDFNVKWLPHHKGGDFRKYYGNQKYIVYFYNDGEEIKKSGVLNGYDVYLKKGITWTALTSSKNSFRYSYPGFTFDSNKGPLLVDNGNNILFYLLSLFLSPVTNQILKILNPTISLQNGDMDKLPIIIDNIHKKQIDESTQQLISLSKQDWDSYETSWDFTVSPLVTAEGGTLEERYTALRRKWRERTEEMRRLEIENNRIFIKAYGLESELAPEVPWNEITLTCNPWYRYKKSPDAESEDGAMPIDDELEKRLLEDTMKELVSYGIGCMMGRYSLAKGGLILANQGEGYADYLAKAGGNEPFDPDRDGIIPILDEEWFQDDVVFQFRLFLKAAFGEESFTENLRFLERALGKDLRKYFLKDFYKDHYTRYNRRPIYWLFTSPKGAFNALVYLHRYTPDTMNLVLNEYLRELMVKMQTRLKQLASEANKNLSPSEKTRNLRLQTKYAAALSELTDYERDVVYPLAQVKPVLDLDDGVKVNYPKFAPALKPIPGLESKEDS